MERILVVEDDNFFREMFSDLIREKGHEADTASSGVEALEKLNEREYRVVVVDLVLPDISGLEVLSKIKDRDPAIEVVMVTGHANVETAISALKSGARDYLVKPINHEEFKHSIGLCIEQRRLLDENQELKGLVNMFQTSQTIANCLDLERIYKLVVDAVAKEVGVARGLGFFLDTEGYLALKDVKGFDDTIGTEIAEVAMATYNRHKDASGNYLVVDDFPPDSVSARTNDLQEAIFFFVRSKSMLQGIVALFNDKGKRFPADINFKNLTFLLEQSSLAFENAARYTTAKNLLNIDELTGLFNYRYLETALEREIKRAERYGSTLSVIFLDLDQFKNVNDKYGHLIGSKVLKEVGMLLKKVVREVDTVIRYGGDEYTIILVESVNSAAATVAERIRSAVEAHTFVAQNGYDIKVTASLGYACYPDDSKSKVELLELADQAMYQGKDSGKNIVYHIAQKRGDILYKEKKQRGDKRNKGI